MKTTHFRMAALVAALVLARAHEAAAMRSGDRGPRRQPVRLYKVTDRDEKSGRDRFGFIDRTGKLVIDFGRLPETTVEVSEFHEGRAMLVVKQPRARFGKAVGFIDEMGRVVVAPRFDAARDFSEGLALVRGEAFSGFIDRGGREAFKNGDWDIGNFHEGLASAGASPRAPTAGYIDRTGKTVIERKYWFADDFSEGLAAVVVGERRSLKTYGFINRQGEMVISPRFAPRTGNHRIVAASRFSEGLACVGGDGVYGYIDKGGEYVIPPLFRDAQDFSEGLAWVKTFDGKTGWIDKTGRLVITVEEGKAHPSGVLLAAQTSLTDSRFSEGLVPFATYVAEQTFFGYMDQKGRTVIEPQALGSAGPFRGGLARVTFFEKGEYREGRSGHFKGETRQFMEEKYGYIDRMGRFVWRSP